MVAAGVYLVARTSFLFALAPATLSLIAAIGAVGINILTGFTGQISLGQGAFLGVGAYTSAYITAKMGLSFWIGVPAAGIVTAMAGMVFGIPSLRLKGLYLAMATLAAHFLVEFVVSHWDSMTGGVNGITTPAAQILGFAFDTPAATVPTPTSDTSLTCTRADGFEFFRSWMSCLRSSIE